MSEKGMTKHRLEAFSDGVLAVAITIMVLEIKVPHGNDWAQILPLMPKFLSYVLSFIYLGIYWNNHHHMLHTLERVNGRILWANHHLLFWLTLIPFATGWVGENHFTAIPIIAYSFVLLMCGIAYYILQETIIASQGPQSKLKLAVQGDWKGKASPLFYIVAMLVAPWLPSVAMLILISVALIWLVPDRRIERTLN